MLLQFPCYIAAIYQSPHLVLTQISECQPPLQLTGSSTSQSGPSLQAAGQALIQA